MMATYAAGLRDETYEPAPEAPEIDHEALDALTARRFRFALKLTGVMLVLYFGFILLIAFNRDLLATKLVDGLTLGMALGVGVILSTWVLTWVYVRWANRVYEPAVAELGGVR
jgi:uncharacterized membrane protein (DUF485 family)